MARVARPLFIVGAGLSLLGILLPHAGQADVAGFAAIGVVAAITAAALSYKPQRLPLWSFPVAMALGTVLVAFAVYFSGERRGAAAADNEMLFLWPALYSAYFFGRRGALAQVGLIGLVYAFVLVASDAGRVGWARWIVTFGMLALSSILVNMLRERVNQLIADLREAARTDALTGLLNRRGFQETFEAELSRARRTQRPVGILLGDLDHFKHLNDLLGHPAGDLALRRAAAILDDGTRSMDAVARIGGEEFALIVPEEDAATVLALAERLRREIEQSFATDPFPLTTSFGVAGFPSGGDESGELMRAADAALYAAKDRGRNRSVLFDDSFDVGVSSQSGEATSSP